MASGCHVQGNDSTLASGVTIGFDDDGCTVLFQISKGVVSLGEGSMLCGGNIGFSHQFFGKGFAALEGRSCRTRAEDGETTLAKDISDALNQGDFWPDHCQVNTRTLSKLGQFSKLGNAQRD